MPPESPRLTSLKDALTWFAFPDASVQTSRHILRLHWYVSCRLVIEGGFHPDRIRPRPPIAVKRRRDGLLLRHDPEVAKSGERTILGGLKTKRLDVTVMFRRLYAIYDRRFVYNAPALRSRTEREVWDRESPLLTEMISRDEGFAEMEPRMG